MMMRSHALMSSSVMFSQFGPCKMRLSCAVIGVSPDWSPDCVRHTCKLVVVGFRPAMLGQALVHVDSS